MWNLGGEYTAFILCCNTHKRSLAKDNTCRKEAAASVHVYIYTKSSQLLSCSSRGVCQVSWMPMTSCTLKSRQHFFPALVKKTVARRGKSRIPLMDILFPFWNHPPSSEVCRWLKAAFSCQIKAFAAYCSGTLLSSGVNRQNKDAPKQKAFESLYLVNLGFFLTTTRTIIYQPKTFVRTCAQHVARYYFLLEATTCLMPVSKNLPAL